MKYIVKNCPALNHLSELSLIANDNSLKKCYMQPNFCKDITDCVMKRIVELCKIEIKPIQVYHATGDLPFVQTALNRKGADFAVKIIELLEIEEVRK